jgi:hypothetical protein
MEEKKTKTGVVVAVVAAAVGVICTGIGILLRKVLHQKPVDIVTDSVYSTDEATEETVKEDEEKEKTEE